MSRCSSCGQMLKADAESDTCVRCTKAQEADTLREQRSTLAQQNRQLRDQISELKPKAEIYDSIIRLLALGLSPAQCLDVAFCHIGSEKPKQWATRRGVTPAAVYNNIADAKEAVGDQQTLTDYARGQERSGGVLNELSGGDLELDQTQPYLYDDGRSQLNND